MEYKYLLEVLKSGLYEEYYDDLHFALIPFLDAEVYGRSILENSTFIVSSVFFNKEKHGTGFVARLSGATAEFLHMLRIMNLGEKPFKMKDTKEIFMPDPVLNKKLFTKKAETIEFNFKTGKKEIQLAKNSYGFSVFTNTFIVYKNPKNKNTYGKNKVSPVRYTIYPAKGKKQIINSTCLAEPYVSLLRNSKINKIEILLD